MESILQIQMALLIRYHNRIMGRATTATEVRTLNITIGKEGSMKT